VLHSGATHMVLSMARPQLHPRSGVYWLRKRVPADLVALVGRREEYFSLQTRDPEEAKRRHVDEMARLEARWAALRAGPRTITEREAHELAVEAHDRWLEEFREFPSRQTFWPTEIGAELWSTLIGSRTPSGELLTSDKTLVAKVRLQEWCSEQADILIQRRGLLVDDAGREQLARAVAAAIQRASLTLSRLARGDRVELDGVSTPLFVAQPAAKPVRAAPTPGQPVRFEELVEAWAAETGPAPKTKYEWSRVFRKLASFAGHDDASRVTSDDIIRWKDKLVSDGLNPKTIRDANIAAVRGILKWAVKNRRIHQNPAEHVSIDVKRKPGQSIRGFTDEEASRVLRAAASEVDPVRRWIPWICAFTGARLSEVCQLRVEDIQQVGSVWVMRFDAEAGSLKNVNSERTIPIHSALIAGGFLKLVEARGAGPLFPSLRPDTFGKRGGNGTKLLGRWVRGLGLTDERINPSHSWRHRFKTLARRHELKTDVADAITGHGRRSIGDTYGEYEIAAMQREIEKIPGLS
jgi:integrase